ncbi:MAG: DNA-binding protein [Deltaproteobacteria bacterium]|nr:DNA-binding protein [Deltaproteobacteria bacterium]
MAQHGNQALLETQKLALLCSRACPGSIIVQTLDVVRSLRETPWTVVSGFQSPLEQECLAILLRGEHPAIVCPARSAKGMRISAAWNSAVSAGRMLITSPFEETVRRATAALAQKRNRFVVRLADAVFIPHAAPGGSLDRLCRDHIAGRKSFWTLDDPANVHLTALGATVLAPSSQDMVNLLASPSASRDQAAGPPNG